MLRYYDHFVLPFTVGVVVLFSVIIYKYVRWFSRLPREDKRLVGRGLFTLRTLGAAGEAVCESLLHRRIFKVNPVLGYMHMSLAFGWFLLIVVGWFEASMHLSGDMVPPHAHVFFKFFAPSSVSTASDRVLGFTMDLLLLFVLSGVLLAWIKRMRSRVLGMRKTTKHTLGDRVALLSLWFVFPARLIAESSSSGIDGGATFLTGTIGRWMLDEYGINNLFAISAGAWWFYSLVLGVFFVSMPFSRYMHIFTEIPLIFLRRWGVRSDPAREKSFDHFQLEACSRCGICIDPCQLQSELGINNVQSAYFVRDRRYNKLEKDVATNCLMCGRCDARCPVGIDLGALRLNSRQKYFDVPADRRYDYIRGADTSTGSGRVGYFAGCMTLLSPATMRSMERIFDAAGEGVWWADRDGGVCCGRPLKLSGEIAAARRMMDHNRGLFEKHGITTLVTSCPICLRVFREDYDLQGIKVLHHSQYIQRLIESGKIAVAKGDASFTYHDPCELGRGCGIYDEPRAVLRSVGALREARDNRANALCCGSSLANMDIDERQQNTIARGLADQLAATGADRVVTGCPLCKKAIARHAGARVCDIAEVVAGALRG